MLVVLTSGLSLWVVHGGDWVIVVANSVGRHAFGLGARLQASGFEAIAIKSRSLALAGLSEPNPRRRQPNTEPGSFAIDKGWIELHESGTFVKFTQAGAELLA